MGELNSYKDLNIWQKGLSLCVNTYELTKDFPEEEKFGLISQIRRCSVSISANIAEGYGRQSTKSYVQFLKIARGSLYELDTHLELSNQLKFVKNELLLETIKEQIIEEGKMINSLINKIDIK
jgi:four helix bundle protein